MKKQGLSIKVGEETFSLDSLTMGAMVEVLGFNERYESGEVKLETKDGIIEFANFLVALFNDPKLTYEKVLKVDLLELMETLSLQKVNDWVASMNPSSEPSENGSAEKKDLPQPEKQESPS